MIIWNSLKLFPHIHGFIYLFSQITLVKGNVSLIYATFYFENKGIPESTHNSAFKQHLEKVFIIENILFLFVKKKCINYKKNTIEKN